MIDAFLAFPTIVKVAIVLLAIAIIFSITKKLMKYAVIAAILIIAIFLIFGRTPL